MKSAPVPALSLPGDTFLHSGLLYPAKGRGPVIASVGLHAALFLFVYFLAAAGGGQGGMAGDGSATGAGNGAEQGIGIAGLVAFSPGGKNAVTPQGEAFSRNDALADDTAEDAERRELKAEITPADKAVPVPILDETAKKKKRSGASGARAGEERKKPLASGAPQGGDLRSSARLVAASGAGTTQAPGEGGAGASGTGPGAQLASGGGGGAGPGFAGKVDSKPRVLSRSKVRYPERARKGRITGQVLLRFHLDERGGISHLHVVRADPPGVFDDAALAAVRQWRFAPAMKDGRPVPYWVELPMPFLLQ